MALDHEAIYSAYKGVVVQVDDAIGARDVNGNIVTLDTSKVTAARKAIDDAYAAQEYARNRAISYPPIEEQLDTIYHKGIDEWKKTIKTVKDKYPKE